MVEFSIGTTDITSAIDIQNYNVNQIDVYESWIDGNHREHRNISRHRIEGTFQVGFDNYAARDAFLTLLETERETNGYFNVTSSVNNLSDTVTYEAFIDTEASGNYDVLNERQWLVITITVSER